MTKPYLIDITDARFKIAANDDVIAFIRRTSPFAHPGVGSRLFDLQREIPNALAYCPRPSSCTYVVLHTEANRIFAIAVSQRILGFRLAANTRVEALADGATTYDEIGPDWIQFDFWALLRTTNMSELLRRWAAQACDDAIAATAAQRPTDAPHAPG